MATMIEYIKGMRRLSCLSFAFSLSEEDITNLEEYLNKEIY